MSISTKAENWIRQGGIYQAIATKKETLWLNDKYLPVSMTESLCQLAVSDDEIRGAEERFNRFAPYIAHCFPETKSNGGIIESPLVPIESMKTALSQATGIQLPGNMLLKMDSHLAIAGSVKARGGIYEVLKHAEDLALSAGKIKKTDSYVRFADSGMKEFLGGYTIQVGSTGNLGLSIGIMSACLGFKVKVHMSVDARQWKKDMLRQKGVEVIEYKDDYTRAVAEGRRASMGDPTCYFVDDEYSVPLFLGYAVAAYRLQKQLETANITIDEKHPLLVYIPCGVGGAPGGICYGLKRVFRDNVHVFFQEPTEFPSVLLGMATETYNHISVKDFGLGHLSHADGLACASPSGFVTKICRNLVAGDCTVEDKKLFDYLRLLYQTENILIEPSSCAAFSGPLSLFGTNAGHNFLKAHQLTPDTLKNATQICWATGGALVPHNLWDNYLNTYL